MPEDRRLGATRCSDWLRSRDERRIHALLVRYYEAHRDAIGPVIERHAARGDQIALWCGGNAGGQPETAFTSVFDPDASKISCLCRAKPDGIANPQDTYPMVRHDQACADVVLFLGADPHKAMLQFAAKGLDPEFVLVEDEIWKSVAHAGCPAGASAGLRGAGGSKACSLTILYNPGPGAADAVESYARDVDKAFVYDNSPDADEELVARIRAIGNVEYVSGGGLNSGICRPVNEVAGIAQAEGFDWMITFDQDSIAREGMVARMRAFADSSSCGPRVALVSPIVRKDRKRYERPSAFPERSYVHHAIQSGLMHRLSAMREIGPYDERMFIDEVEIDYCMRARHQGFHIVRVNDAVLSHQVDDVAKKSVNKYSAMRFYYRTRNIAYMVDRWQGDDPKYAADCMRSLMRLESLVSVDEGPGDKALAMMLGYAHHHQGKWPAYEEALREAGGHV